MSDKRDEAEKQRRDEADDKRNGLVPVRFRTKDGQVKSEPMLRSAVADYAKGLESMAEARQIESDQIVRRTGNFVEGVKQGGADIDKRGDEATVMVGNLIEKGTGHRVLLSKELQEAEVLEKRRAFKAHEAKHFKKIDELYIPGDPGQSLLNIEEYVDKSLVGRKIYQHALRRGIRGKAGLLIAPLLMVFDRAADAYFREAEERDGKAPEYFFPELKKDYQPDSKLDEKVHMLRKISSQLDEGGQVAAHFLFDQMDEQEQADLLLQLYGLHQKRQAGRKTG